MSSLERSMPMPRIRVLLLTALEEAAAGVRVAAAERAEHLLQRHAVRLHPRGVDGDVVLA